MAVYYGIGKYVSKHTRKGVWGSGALETISNQLRRELPGLRGFSATSLKKMRLFYDNWLLLDANSSVATDELEKPASQLAELETLTGNEVFSTSPNASDYMGGIDIHHNIQITNITDFPVEDFFKVPFSHHVEILKPVIWDNLWDISPFWTRRYVNRTRIPALVWFCANRPIGSMWSL